MVSVESLFDNKENAGYERTEIGEFVSLDTKDTEVIYNGEPHSAAVPDVVCSGYDETEFKIEYSDNGSDWSTDPSSVAATKVRDSRTVYVRVSGTGISGYVEGTEKITILPKPVVIRVKNADKTVGDNDPAFLGNGDQAGFVSTDDIGIRYSRTDVSDNSIGVHKGVLTGDILYGNTEDYEITIVPGDLTINDVSFNAARDSSMPQNTESILTAPSVPQSMPGTLTAPSVPQSMPGHAALSSTDKSGKIQTAAGIILLIAVAAAAIVCLIHSKVQNMPFDAGRF